MSEGAVAGRGRIFISYRREESAYPAGWLFDRLVDHFGEPQVFKDVDSIEPGDDFIDMITTAVGSCDVLLALIGDQWLTMTDSAGNRRLDDPTDFVRLEVEAALSRNVRVIPVLVGPARMPRADELPPSLAGLVRRQALELSPSRFEADFGRLLRVLQKTLAETQRPGAVIAEPAPDVRDAVARTDDGSSTAAAPSGVRRLLSTRAGRAAAAAALILLVVLVFALANGSDPPSSGDDPSSEEVPAEEEEGAWPGIVDIPAPLLVMVQG